MRNVGALICILCFLLGPTSAAAAIDEDELVFQAGSFDTFHGTEATQLGLEYRAPGIETTAGGKRFGSVHAIAGGSMTGNLSGYLYSGARFSAFLTKRLVFAPSFAVGFYGRGRGLDLGGPLEFRSGAELSVRLNDGGSAGMVLYHYSNARIYDSNPGTEALMGTYTFNLPGLRRAH